MAYQHTFKRHKTREVGVGNLVVGGDNPIWVQSMTTPDTHDVEATVAEIRRLEEAGCEIVRVTVPKPEDAGVLSEIKRRIKLPPGSMMVYASTNAHRVEPVTRGTRLAAIFWIQSMIREEAKRDLLFDLNHVITALHGKVGHAENMALSSVYHNLLRMWAET